MDMESNEGSGQVQVVAMPYPGRGHINPMLNLCRLLVSHSSNILVTFVVTPEWLQFLKSTDEPPPPHNIRLVSLPNQLIPSESSRAQNFPEFFEATATKLESPFEQLLHQLDPPAVTCIIYDTYLGWVVDVATRHNIPVASLFTQSASVFTFLSHFHLLPQHSHFPIPNLSQRGGDIVDYIPGLPTTTIADVITIFDGDCNKVLDRVLEAISRARKTKYVLFTSIYEMEQGAIETTKVKLGGVKVYSIGPMIPYFNLQAPIGNKEDEAGYFKWLESQPHESVLYISQGSFLSVSTDQMDEIVAGIKLSGVRFLWVTRRDSSRFKHGDGDGDEGMMGYYVSWCNQLKVLCHPSVGGFWTHCGWNSTSEALYAGIPMLTSPIFWDQIPNSKQIVKDWKIGRRVIHHRDKVVTRHQIAQVVKNFMDPNSPQRQHMVSRAHHLKEILRSSVSHGGSASSDLQAFIRNIISK